MRERDGRDQRGLAVLPRHRKDRAANDTTAGAVRLVNIADKIFLPSVELERLPRAMTRRDREVLNECDDAPRARLALRAPLNLRE
jgi:hypothetical protein